MSCRPSGRTFRNKVRPFFAHHNAERRVHMFPIHNDILFVVLCGLAGLFVLYATVRDRAIISRIRKLNSTKAKKGARHE